MWLITPIGFFSIVQKPGDKQNGSLTVRSRVRSDLVALKKHYLPGLGPIQEGKGTDYRFRAVAPRSEVASAMARMVDALDYSNFKGEVGKKQGHKRSNLYHKVWDVLYKLQTDPAFVEKAPAVDSYGGVVISGGGRVLLREPTKQYGGYAWTFAKTKANPGESARDAAIRAVREKTGYDAQIRISVPGLFKGSSSSTNYYVMDARHPPNKPNWQTSSLRWVKFEEARDLIRQSPDAKGRDRDLAILDAAEKAASALPYKEHPIVQPEDWSDLSEMPERHTVLYPKLKFNPDEMVKIRRGFFPTVMQQKWFLYFSGERLRMHRSWGGIQIFDVGFAFDSKGGAHVTDAIANREGEHGSADDNEDLKLIEKIIRYDLLNPLEEPAMEDFVKAWELAMKPKYLGSPEVVTALVKEFFDASIRVLTGKSTEADFLEAATKFVKAFSDDDAGYTRMPGWHSAEQMGSYVKKYLGVSNEEEDLEDILGYGVHALISKITEILEGFSKAPGADEEAHAMVQLNALQQFVVAVLLGTNTVSHGGW
jgi:ADP-ribose pyrophosphatase YjhB (NUDIX family)